MHRHAGAHEILHHRCQRIDEQARHDPGDKAQRGKEEHRRERAPVGFLGTLGRGGAGASKKRHSERLDEACGRKRRRQRKQGADRGYQQLQAPGRQLRAQQNGLECQPF